jgi:hydrogenase maturation protease
MRDDMTPPPRDAPATARTVVVDGVTLGRGSRVRLNPGRRADIFDLVLTGRTAEIDSVEEDMEGRIHVAVLLDGDAGRDFTTSLGHRFFFSPEELTPATDDPVRSEAPVGGRVLVAGIGNIFMADDAFGPEVITAVRSDPLPVGVHAADFGIRGMDLAYRLLDGYDTAVLVDAAPRGDRPGTLYVIEPGPGTDDRAAAPEAHAMDPAKVLALAGQLGDGTLPRILVLGCEPQVRMSGEEADVVVGLSPPVREAIGPAVDLLRHMVRALLHDPLTPLDELVVPEDVKEVTHP